MTFIHLLRVYLQRKVALKVLICSTLCCFLYLLDCWPDFIQTIRCNIPGVDVYYFTNYTTRYGVYRKFTYVLCAYPFAANFCSEWISRNTYYLCSRSSKKQYVLSNFIFCALVGGLVAGLAQILFISLTSFFAPFGDGYSTSNPFTHNVYYDLLVNGHIYGYYTCSVYHSFLAGALWSTVGMSISIWFTSSSVAVVSPFLIYYIYTQICTLAHIARSYRLDYMLSILADTNSLVFGLLFPLGIVVLCIFFQVLVFYHRLIWRLNHESHN